MGKERPSFPTQPLAEATTQPSSSPRERKTFRGLRGAVATGAVLVASIAAASLGGNGENPSSPNEPDGFSDIHNSRFDPNLEHDTVANIAPIEMAPKDPDGVSLGPPKAESIPLIDSDGDGCTDVEERGPIARMGGQRDPENPWDFFDTTDDKLVDIRDIQQTAYRFGVVKGQPLYDPKFDRSPIGPNNWNLGPGDGKITMVDVMAAFAQYTHQCGPDSPYLYFLKHQQEFMAQKPQEPYSGSPPFDPDEPQTLPTAFGGPPDDAQFENLLNRIAAEALIGKFQPFTATEQELSVTLREAFNNYLQTASASQPAAAGVLVCNMQTGDFKIYQPLNYLWGAGGGCEPGEIDYARVSISLQYYDWDDSRWRHESNLGSKYNYDVSRFLKWGAFFVQGYAGLVCKRIRADFKLEESKDSQLFTQYSSGECY